MDRLPIVRAPTLVSSEMEDEFVPVEQARRMHEDPDRI
jgi:pimeloyl-ACP methyl ester carboxylesterase